MIWVKALNCAAKGMACQWIRQRPGQRDGLSVDEAAVDHLCISEGFELRGRDQRDGLSVCACVCGCVCASGQCVCVCACVCGGGTWCSLADGQESAMQLRCESSSVSMNESTST